MADYAIYPFGVFGIGKPDYELAKNTFLNRPVPGMGNGWEPAAICAARLGLADEAARLVLAHMNHNLRFNNGGWYSPTSVMFAGMMPDVPYFDSPGVSNQAIQEMALQSHDGALRIAPRPMPRRSAKSRSFPRPCQPDACASASWAATTARSTWTRSPCTGSEKGTPGGILELKR